MLRRVHYFYKIVVVCAILRKREGEIKSGRTCMAYSGGRRERCLNTTIRSTCVARALCGMRKRWTSIWPTRTEADRGTKCHIPVYPAKSTATISSLTLSKLPDKHRLGGCRRERRGIARSSGVSGVRVEPALDGP